MIQVSHPWSKPAWWATWREGCPGHGQTSTSQMEWSHSCCCGHLSTSPGKVLGRAVMLRAAEPGYIGLPPAALFKQAGEAFQMCGRLVILHRENSLCLSNTFMKTPSERGGRRFAPTACIHVLYGHYVSVSCPQPQQPPLMSVWHDHEFKRDRKHPKCWIWKDTFPERQEKNGDHGVDPPLSHGPSLKAQGKCWWAKCPGAFGGGGGGNLWKSKKLAGMDRRHNDISFIFWKLSLSKQKCMCPFAEFAWKKWQLNMWRQKPLVSAPQYCLHLARVCIRVSARLCWRLTTCFANQWLSQQFFSQVESYILFPRQ